MIMFNTDTDRSEDVSHAIAEEIMRRLGLEGRSCRQGWRTSSIATLAGSPADAAAGADVAAATPLHRSRPGVGCQVQAPPQPHISFADPRAKRPITARRG